MSDLTNVWDDLNFMQNLMSPREWL